MSETLRLAVRALVAADAAWTERAVPASVRARYLHLRLDFRLTPEEAA